MAMSSQTFPETLARGSARSALSPSTILNQIADDLARRLGGDCAATGRSHPSLCVEAVVPRRIGSFRAAPAPDSTESLRNVPWIRSPVVVRPNVYFDVALEQLSPLLCRELTPERGFGLAPNPALVGRTVSLAFCSPNANKPLHLGHARNMLLGAAIGNLLAFAGADLRRSCCISDYGMHIFKALAAYFRSGAGSTPTSTGEKPDHFVGRFYARYATDPTLAEGPGSPAELMRLWMAGSMEARDGTRQLSAWAESGFDETFDAWGIRFDHRFHETEEHPYIEAFLAAQARAGRVHRDDGGRHVVRLPPDGSVVALTRSDGSPLYMSHMIAAILQRLEAFGPHVHELIALTGEEQVVPFRQLHSILDHLGYASHVELRHLTHGLVYDQGRGLSSRDGTSLTLDRVVEELAAALAVRRPSHAVEPRARATLALYLLSRSIGKPIHYSSDDCLRVGTRLFLAVGEVLRLTAQPPVGTRHASGDHRLERWVMRLGTYPIVLDRAIKRFDPSILLNYLNELCRDFVRLYHCNQVPRELLAPARAVTRHAVALLNIPSHQDVFDGSASANGGEPGLARR